MSPEDSLAEINFDFKDYPSKLNLGCGFDRKEGYLNIDMNEFHKPDLVADICDLKILPSNYYEEIIAQDVLEHIERGRTKQVLAEWNRLLKMNGILKIQVPNLLGLFSLFEKKENQSIEKQKELVQCLFGTQAYSGDFHYTSFTEVLLRHYLSVTGFSILQLSIRDEWLFVGVAEKIKECELGELFNTKDYQEFLTKAYITILKRVPDRGGFDYYLSKLESGEMTKDLIVNILLNSNERKNLR
jgi:predicted SAM-dependent methyltransferase